MRTPEYLSPTSMSKWNENPNAYYKKYLSDVREDDEPQTQPMAVGSAFDAYVKSFLYEALFGSPGAPGNDPRFSREAIFEEQVDPHNRDFGKAAGEHCLTIYRALGALDGLLIDLGRSKGPPKFEMDVRGKVSYGHSGVVREVPFRVKPDLHFINEHGAFVILDWKVNGYCANSAKSPTQGFVRARRQGKMPWTHDECQLGTHKGIHINKVGLEKYDSDWARQCAIGAWVCGADVGSDFVAIIHQLACAPTATKPKITVAEHAAHVTPAYQEMIHAEAVAMWTALTEKQHDGSCWRHAPDTDARYYIECACPRHVFRRMTLEESIKNCELLDRRQEFTGMLNPALE